MSNKTIWLINPYGPIPTENWRSYCFAIIGETLAEANYNVVWWTSSFSHHFKTQRAAELTDLKINENFKIKLIPTTGYKKNIGFGRIYRDWIFSIKTHFIGKHLAKPDLIIYSESPLSFGIGGYSLAKHHKIPVIFHQMDLWPELITQSFPRKIQGIVDSLLKPIYSNRRKTYENLDGVIALAEPYLKAALNIAPNLRNKPHELIYNGIDVDDFRKKMISSSEKDFLIKKTGEIWAIFAGSLGPSYDITNLIQASKKLSEQNRNIKILIAGDGPFKQMVENAAKKPHEYNLIYLGKLLPDDLNKIYSDCDIGFCAYKSSSNVEMPDKIYDYTAAGLAIINSLKGEVSTVVKNNGIGLQYDPEKENDLHEKLLSITNNISILNDMKQKSFELGFLFDQKQQYKKLLPLINKIIRS